MKMTKIVNDFGKLNRVKNNLEKDLKSEVKIVKKQKILGGIALLGGAGFGLYNVLDTGVSIMVSSLQKYSLDVLLKENSVVSDTILENGFTAHGYGSYLDNQMTDLCAYGLMSTVVSLGLMGIGIYFFDKKDNIYKI